MEPVAAISGVSSTGIADSTRVRELHGAPATEPAAAPAAPVTARPAGTSSTAATAAPISARMRPLLLVGTTLGSRQGLDLLLSADGRGRPLSLLVRTGGQHPEHAGGPVGQPPVPPAEVGDQRRHQQRPDDGRV